MTRRLIRWLVLPLVACAPAEPAREAPRPHVVVITIDTLRTDRLGCYGHERPTSPRIDRFAAEQAVRYTQAHSTSSFTPPSHASLFTSRYVSEHGLLTWNELPAENLTLAEVLAEHGYRTAASVSLPNFLTAQKLGQGFQWTAEGGRNGTEVAFDALQHLRSNDPRPLFLWLHLYDVHWPYGRHPDWTRRFNADGRRGVGDIQEHYSLKPEDVSALGLDESDLAFIVDRYDAGIAYTDSVLAPVLEELSRPERVADTLVVLTSDHGESLLERRERIFTHDPFLYDSVTSIPLLIRYPGAQGAGRTSDAQVSLIDVAPTVLDLLDIPRPDAFRGESLLPLLAGAELGRQEIFMECWGWEMLKAARSPTALVVRDLAAGSSQYFDLVADPGQQAPLAAPGAEHERLDRLLDEFMASEGAVAEAPEVDPEVRRQLEELGYIR